MRALARLRRSAPLLIVAIMFAPGWFGVEPTWYGYVQFVGVALLGAYLADKMAVANRQRAEQSRREREEYRRLRAH